MKSRLQGILFAFFGTLVIYSLVKTDIAKNISKLRFLSKRTVEEIREDMCGRVSSLEEFYKKEGPEYDYTPPEGSSSLITIIKNFVKSSTTDQDLGKDELKDYFKDSAGYICILILFVILCILWIPYFCCICFKRCLCFTPNSCTKCPKFFLIGGIILCGGAAINCFIGYTENGAIVDGVYGLGCSVLKVEQHLLDGDEYTSTKPYWMGLSKILKKLEETKNNINYVFSKTNEVKINIESLFDSFQEDLLKESTDRLKEQVTSPDPKDNLKKISPILLNSYGPLDKENTALGGINNELSQYKNFFQEGFKDIYTTINSVDDKFNDDMDEIMYNLEKNINKTSKTISNRITEYDDTLVKINTHAKRYINTFFSINLVVAIAVGVSLLLILMCKHGTFVLCISWFFLYVLMLLTFFLGAVFGLIGSFMQDASYGGSYLTKNLNEIETLDSQALDIAEVCLNGNGSLSNSEVIPNDFDFSKVDDIFALENDINDGIQTLEKTHPISTEQNKEIYDIIMTSKDYLFEIQTPLEEVKQYLYNSETQVSDEWVVNENDCQYPYYRKNNLRYLKEEEGRCLVIQEWTEQEIIEEYQGFSTFDEIKKYYKSISEYLNSMEALISEIKVKNNDFNTSFNLITNEEMDGLSDIKDKIIPLKETYNEIVGEDNSIFEILNCKFLKRDVNKILEEMYDSFGNTFKNTSTLLLLISGFELGMTIFILVIIKSKGRKKSS